MNVQWPELKCWQIEPNGNTSCALLQRTWEQILYSAMSCIRKCLVEHDAVKF